MDRIWPTEGGDLLIPERDDSAMVSSLIRICGVRKGRLVSLALEVYNFRGSEMIALKSLTLKYKSVSAGNDFESSTNIWFPIEMQIPGTSNPFKLTNSLYILE